MLGSLVTRSRELTVSVPKTVFSEFPHGISAHAPLLRTLKIHYPFPSAIAEEETVKEVNILSNICSRIFKEAPLGLETLELTSFDFTEEWLVCMGLKSVSIRYNTHVPRRMVLDDPHLIPESLMLRHLSSLPDLECLYVSEGGTPRWAFPPAPAILNSLRTLTVSNMTDQTLKRMFVSLDLPALKQFNLLSYSSTNSTYHRWHQPPAPDPWECKWLDAVVHDAQCLNIVINDLSVQGFRFGKREETVMAEIQLSETPDCLPSLRIALPEISGYRDPEETLPSEYVLLFDVLVHRLRHPASSIIITSIGSRKTLSPATVLQSFFQCPNFSSLAIKNCNVDAVIAALMSIETAAPGPSRLQRLIFHDCTVDAEQLADYIDMANKGPSGRNIQLDLTGSVLAPDRFEKGRLGTGIVT